MWIVALALFYFAFAVVVGRFCRLNSRLEDEIVRDPAVIRRERGVVPLPSMARPGPSAEPTVEVAHSRPLHSISAAR